MEEESRSIAKVEEKKSRRIVEERRNELKIREV